MDKITKFLGIDVSKEVLDVSASDGKHFQFYNDPSGDQKLIALLDLQGHCVMEATACCHQSLETWLCTKVMLSVVNPPTVKRFIQMRLRLAKTDKADAEMRLR